MQTAYKKSYLGLILVNLFCFYVFFETLTSFDGGGLIQKADSWVNYLFENNRTVFWDKIMVAISSALSPGILSSLAITIAIVLAFNKKWLHLAFLASGILGGQIIKNFLKSAIGRDRPENSLLEVSENSFPSAHALIATIFFVAVSYSLGNRIKNIRLRYSFIAANYFLFLLAGLSRVYLNVHWLSDVLAGFALGIFWMTFLVIIFKAFSDLTGKKRIKKIRNILERHLAS